MSVAFVVTDRRTVQGLTENKWKTLCFHRSTGLRLNPKTGKERGAGKKQQPMILPHPPVLLKDHYLPLLKVGCAIVLNSESSVLNSFACLQVAGPSNCIRSKMIVEFLDFRSGVTERQQQGVLKHFFSPAAVFCFFFPSGMRLLHLLWTACMSSWLTGKVWLTCCTWPFSKTLTSSALASHLIRRLISPSFLPGRLSDVSTKLRRLP